MATRRTGLPEGDGDNKLKTCGSPACEVSAAAASPCSPQWPVSVRCPACGGSVATGPKKRFWGLWTEWWECPSLTRREMKPWPFLFQGASSDSSARTFSLLTLKCPHLGPLRARNSPFLGGWEYYKLLFSYSSHSPVFLELGWLGGALYLSCVYPRFALEVERGHLSGTLVAPGPPSLSDTDAVAVDICFG